MAQTLDISSARLQAGAVNGGVIREAFGKLDGPRIAAESGAIALHVGALMLLLAPLSMPPAAPPETEEVIYEQVKRETPPPPPPVVVPVERHVAPTHAPVVQQVQVQPPPITVADPNESDRPPIEVATVITPTIVESIDRPLEGAHLEYETAPPPRYTSEMMRAGMQGTVLLRVLVDIDGKPLDVSIERSSGHRELDQLARRQVLGKWRFKPAMQDGQRVQAIGMVPVDFRLN